MCKTKQYGQSLVILGMCPNIFKVNGKQTRHQAINQQLISDSPSRCDYQLHRRHPHVITVVIAVTLVTFLSLFVFFSPAVVLSSREIDEVAGYLRRGEVHLKALLQVCILRLN